MVEDVIRGFENTIDGICSSEGSTDQDDILAVETCNKETNTVQMKYPKALTGSGKSHHAIGMEFEIISAHDYFLKMSLVLRKPVFGVSDQVPHKPGCTITEDG